jgi:DNA-binding transcriptional ArsR family regulator
MLMGTTKTFAYSKKHNERANLLKAIAHPARLAIVEILIQNKSCMYTDFITELPLAQSTISQHLKALKSAGIIKGTVEGNSICYCIDSRTLKKLTSILLPLASSTNHNNCC